MERPKILTGLALSAQGQTPFLGQEFLGSKLRIGVLSLSSNKLSILPSYYSEKTIMKKHILCSLLALVSVHSVSASLEQSLSKIEQEIKGQVGVAVIDTQSHNQWSYNGNQRFPMMSSFKTLACAKLLYDVEQKKLTLNQKIDVPESGLVNWNPITENFVGSKMSLQSVCAATMLMSDNYAANLALQQIGGPSGLTAFLREIGDQKTRLDRYEPELNYVEKGAENDTTTPIAITQTIKRLLTGDVLSTSSKTQLQFWMTNNMFSDSLARAVLPQGWLIADRSGGGVKGSRALTAMVWKSDRKPLFIGIFIANSSLSTLPEINQVVADISQLIFAQYGIE
ncbi:class A beta-lactamase [Vibrio tetraodonis]|nr:class A beta-lactamase [Vibrio tetraodonis]